MTEFLHEHLEKFDANAINSNNRKPREKCRQRSTFSENQISNSTKCVHSCTSYIDEKERR